MQVNIKGLFGCFTEGEGIQFMRRKGKGQDEVTEEKANPILNTLTW